MSRPASDRAATADAGIESGDGPTEYERLRTKKKERRGKSEPAEIRDVFVGPDEAVLTLAFDWTADTERLAYDLDDDRDVLQLESLAESEGFDFEQLSFLEGQRIRVVYTGSEWVPEAHLAAVEGAGSAGETFRTELRLLARELARSPKLLRRLIRLSRTMTTRQLIVAVVIVKKLVIVALLAWLLL